MWQTIGQDRAVSLLQRSLERHNLAHAYLFSGPPHTGKMTLALDLARALNCQALEPPCGECPACQRIASGNYTDVQVISLADAKAGESKARAEISIDDIRQMQHSASLPPFEGTYKVFIIDGAESLSNEAANCLLKTLEEPVGRVVFILLTVKDSLLPATVISRCQKLELRPLSPVTIESALGQRGIEPPKAKVLARICRGGVGWAITAAGDDTLLRAREEKMDRLVGLATADIEGRFAFAGQLANQFSQDRGAVLDMLDLWLEYWRDVLMLKIDCPAAIINIGRMQSLVEAAHGYSPGQVKAFIDRIRAAGEQLRLNANPKLALEVLMLDMPGRN